MEMKMTKAEALKVLPKLENRLNDALAVIGHPVRFEVLVDPDKGDPLNQRVICTMRVDFDVRD